MSEEITFDLRKPLSYAYKGDMAQASFITLRPPTYAAMAHFVPLKQALSAAIRDLTRDQAEAVGAAQKDPDGQKETGLDAEVVLSVLYQGKGDVYKVLLSAQELFRSGVALVEGETKLTLPMIEALDPLEFERMVGTYLAAFVAPSLMGGQKPSTAA